MGNKHPKDINQSDVQSEINIELTNETQNLNKILNEQITNISTSIINQNAADINISTGGNNLFTADEITIEKKGVLDVNQQIDIQSTNTAVLNLLQDQEALNDFSSKLSEQLQNSVSNSTSITTAMQNVAGLTNANSSAGGLASMLQSVMDTLKSVNPLNAPVSTSNISACKTAIKQTFKNITLNQNDIQNIIHNNISNSIKNMNSQSCNISTTGNNQIMVGNLKIKSEGVATIKQSQSIKAFNSCLNKLVSSSKITNQVATAATTQSTTDTKNSNEASTAASAAATVTTSTVMGDSIGDTFKSILTNPGFLMVGGVMCCVVLVLLCIAIYIKFGKKMKKGSQGGQQQSFEEYLPQ